MLYAQFKEVLKLDEAISDLHRELDNMYKKRAEYLGQPGRRNTAKSSARVNDPFEAEVERLPSVVSHKTASRLELPDPIEQVYDELRHSWQNVGIRIPTAISLRKRLSKATAIIRDLEGQRPDLAEQFSVLLVPPGKIMRFPAERSLRDKQIFIEKADSVRAKIKTSPSLKWRVLVVLGGAEGLYMGSPQEIIDEKSYVIAGLNMLDLGPLEYSALTLQSGDPLDEDSWTVLLRGFENKTSDEVPAAHFSNGGYSYSTADYGSVFAADRFRPAIEVK